MIPRNASSRIVCGSVSGSPKVETQTCVCDRPSNRMEPVASPMMTTSARAEPRLEKARAEGASSKAAVLASGDDRQRREAPEEAEPDAEDLAVLAPGPPPVLGHHREREDGVASDDQGERPRARPHRHDLQPDDGAKADGRRPATESRSGTRSARSRGSRPLAEARAPRSWSVLNGSSHVQIGKTNTEIRATPTQP